MRRLLLLSLAMLFVFIIKAQVAVNTNGSGPDNSAMFDVTSTTKGILIPRMNKAQRDLIPAPATGLIIYQTDNVPGLYFFDGSGWKFGGPETHAINDLSDGKSGGFSVFLGAGCGSNDDGTNNYNVAMGADAMNTNTSGSNNSALGASALKSNSTGSNNTATGAIALFSNSNGYSNTASGYNSLALNTAGYRNTASGADAAYYNTTGHDNVALGWRSMYSNSTGVQNIAIGPQSSFFNNSGNNNTVLGASADYYNTSGSNNTLIGFGAGAGSTFHVKSGCVFLGNMAGYYESGDNKLYIENSNTSSPLIYGEFDNKLLRVNGLLEIKNGSSNPGSIRLYEPGMYGNSSTILRAGPQNEDITYTLPIAPGTDGQVLRTNSTGYLSWVDDGGASQISDLSDAKTGGYSVFLGSGAGANDDASNNFNAAVGADAMATNTTGSYNTALGASAFYMNQDGNHNTALGAYALYYNSSGGDNTALGFEAANSNTTGTSNVAIGANANRYNLEGTNNTIIGFEAGRGSSGHNKSGNVFLGFQAGYNETGSNKLYIENSNSLAPLIYGEFDNNLVTVYGNLGIATSSFGNGTRTLALSNGIVPGTSISAGVLLYAESVSGSSELKVRDEAGNVTTLSPHNFSMIDKSEPMAWSFYSENHAEGKRISVDMLKAIRTLEKISGEKLAVIESLDGTPESTNTKEAFMGIIEKQQAIIDDLQKRVQELERMAREDEGM